MARLSMVLGVVAFFGLSCGAAGDDKPKPGDDDRFGQKPISTRESVLARK